MMSDMDVNAIAGTLKLYFRELPEPLFTDELCANFTEGIGQCFSSSNEESFIQKVHINNLFLIIHFLQHYQTVWQRKAVCSICCSRYLNPTC